MRRFYWFLLASNKFCLIKEKFFSSTQSITFFGRESPSNFLLVLIFCQNRLLQHVSYSWALCWPPRYLNWCPAEQSCHFVNYQWWEGVLVRILYLLILKLQRWTLNYVFIASAYSVLVPVCSGLVHITRATVGCQHIASTWALQNTSHLSFYSIQWRVLVVWITDMWLQCIICDNSC